MGLHSKSQLFAILSLFTLSHGENLCPVSSCGSNMFNISYPFKLESETPQNNCNYFNLTCGITNESTILSLPHAGYFYVRSIDYFAKYIQLYDPLYCLSKRFMNFSLESSHLKEYYNENYTFYVCPAGAQLVDSHVYPVACLSNSTNITVATRKVSGAFVDDYGCKRIGSWMIPVSTPNPGFYDDFYLYLTWDVDVCKDCDGNSGPKPIARIVAIALSLPALIIISLSCSAVFCLHLITMISNKIRPNSVAAPTTASAPQTTTLPPPFTALDKSKIMECTEIFVLSESDGRIPNDNGSTCSICLDNYCKKETLRLISKCGHCFHAICIQQWLGKNNTCPVCRTSLSDCDV